MNRPPPQIPRISGIVDHVLRGSIDNQLVVGPLLWQPSDGASSKAWYFIISSAEKGRGWRCDSVHLEPSTPAEDRALVIADIMTRRGVIAHIVDDELYMARLCEALWPGERITAVRKRVEAECARAE